MLQDNFEHSFFKLTAELLETEQVQGSRGISETKLRLDLPLPPATALISWVSKDLMWHSSMKDWFIDLTGFNPFTPCLLDCLKSQEFLNPGVTGKPHNLNG